MRQIILFACLLVTLAATACTDAKFVMPATLAGLIKPLSPPEVHGPPVPEGLVQPSPVAEAETKAEEPEDEDKPLIAIVIDDMGVDRKRSKKALKLPAEVTMSYLPYGHEIKEQVAAAKEAGHEILMHVPMQPIRRTADPGPDFLGVKFELPEIEARLVKNLDAFEGYAGINNHMGSKFTQDRERLEVVMKELKKRDLVFLDSVTIPRSIAEKVAREAGVPATHRDVFLDDEETDTFTENALEQVEAYAKKHGSAIAIGHPKDITLKDLRAWLPTLEKKGFRLVPLTTVLKHRIENAATDKVARFEKK